jgi:RND family efflux transporter MFP subunit
MKRILKRKITWFILGLIILLVVGLTRNSHQQVVGSVAKSAILLSSSDVNSVISGNLSEAINFTGDLSPKEQTVISAEVDARVNRVLVDEGQVVKAGQALAELDTVDLSQAVTQQEAQLARAKSQLELDRQKMEKQSALLKQGFVSQIAYDELVTNYQASLQGYKAQEALLKRSKKQLADTHVTAPFAGVIYQKSIEPGQLALKNTKLFAIANLANMEIKAPIPSDAINRVKVGLPVVFKVETDGRDYAGVVSRINQVAEPGTRSYLVYIDFDNRKSNLKAGQFVKGQIVLRTLTKQLLIPCDALRKLNNARATVLTLANDWVVAKPVQLVLANTQTGMCAVGGLTAQDKVVAGSVLSVKAGDQAKVVD